MNISYDIAGLEYLIANKPIGTTGNQNSKKSVQLEFEKLLFKTMLKPLSKGFVEGSSSSKTNKLMFELNTQYWLDLFSESMAKQAKLTNSKNKQL